MENKYSQFSPEDTAFIYQQIEELKHFLSDQGTVSVLEIPSKSKSHKHALKIVVSDGQEVLLTLKVQGTSVAEAMMTGKKQIYKVLSDMTDEAVSSSQRQSEINDLLKNTTRH